MTPCRRGWLVVVGRSRALVSQLVDDEIDALYDLPPGEFTAARDALVKRLRGEKRRDEADAVKALRRPSVAAWAVNQLARRHTGVLEEVLEAGAQLVAAQRRALSGIKDAGLQRAAGRRREAIQRAWQHAADALAEQGAGTQAHRQAVIDTLEAASVDEEAAAAVRSGRLTTQLAPPSDFGAVSGFALVSDGAQRQGGGGGDDRPEHDGHDEDRKRRRREAEQAAARAQQQADEAQRRAGDARQDAVRARAEAERLAEQAEKASQRAADAAGEAQQRAAHAEQLEHAAAEATEQAQRLAARASS